LPLWSWMRSHVGAEPPTEELELLLAIESPSYETKFSTASWALSLSKGTLPDHFQLDGQSDPAA
jgi:hypothetical protein